MDIRKIEEAKKSLIVRAMQAREQAAFKQMGLWTCPDCGFSFDAAHEDVGGGYSCPACENAALSKANAEMFELLQRIKTEVDEFGRLVGIGIEASLDRKGAAYNAKVKGLEQANAALLEGLRKIRGQAADELGGEIMLDKIYGLSSMLLTQYDTDSK